MMPPLASTKIGESNPNRAMLLGSRRSNVDSVGIIASCDLDYRRLFGFRKML
jgi:hypothetical protein